MENGYEGIMEYVTLYFTTGVRWVCMGLAILILLHQIFALLRMRNPSEIWAYLKCPDGSSVPLTHWENLMGRARGCDIILNLGGVSRSHGTLVRDSEGVWEYRDLNSKNGSYINGRKVTEPAVLRAGDIVTVGGGDFQLLSAPGSALKTLRREALHQAHVSVAVYAGNHGLSASDGHPVPHFSR